MELTVYSESSLHHTLGEIRQAYKAHKFLRLRVKAGKARSLDQNAISHAWYEQVARELREDDALGVKRECKLLYGVPLLRAEEAEFRAKYDALVRGRFDYAEKLELMDWLPVTSLMTKDQLSRYLDAMQKAYDKRGVSLQFPEAA